MLIDAVGPEKLMAGALQYPRDLSPCVPRDLAVNKIDDTPVDGKEISQTVQEGQGQGVKDLTYSK